ncbi:MAG: 4Fe-4S ferredoxin, partial [Imperialibacter sp.]
MSHSTNTETFLKDNKKVDWHNETLWWVRSKRDVSSKQIPEWEQLRELASGIKDSVLSNLAGYLEEFEKNATANRSE